MIRRIAKKRLRCGLLFVGLITLWGCSAARHAAIELDKVSRSIDRYGFASISTPFLAEPTDEFEFDLDKPASEFFNLAMNNVQGGVRNLDSKALDTQTVVRINIEEAIAAIAEVKKAKSLADLAIAKTEAGVQKSLLESLLATNPTLGANSVVPSLIGLLGVVEETPAPDLPEYTPKAEGLPPAGPPLTTDQRVALSAVGAEFTQPLSFPERSFSITGRQAVEIAAGDAMIQSLFRWFVKPRGNKQGDYELFFCPMIVSVQPGYQTRDRYLADITVNVDLGRYNDAGDLELLSESGSYRDSSPPIQVTGVFPVIDSQVLDLVNSRRQLFSTAFQFSVLGFGQQADFFLDYARKLEQDAQTRTALTTASAYTIGDTAFGFRVEPKFVASKDPTRLVTEPGRILESKTFPAFAAVLVDRKYLKRKERKCACDANAGCEEPTDQSNEYDFLVFETGTRWSPMSESRRVFGGLLSWGGRFSEVESWARALALDKAHEWVENGKSTGLFGGTVKKSHHFFFGSVGSTYQRRHLRLRTRSLAKLALDSRAVIRVHNSAAASKIRITDTFPKRGWRDQYTVLTVRGQGFDRNVDAVTVGGVYCEHIISNDCTLLVLVPPWHMANKPIPTKDGGFASHVKRIAELSGGVDPLDITIMSKAAPRPLTTPLTTKLKTGLPESETEWLCVCDPDLEAVVVPPPPLTPEEKKLLAGLNKRIVSCSEECKDGKACRTCKVCKKSEGTDKCTDCKQCDVCRRDCELVREPAKKNDLLNALMTKDYKWHCWNECEDWKKERRAKLLKEKRTFDSGWAQLVISSRVPVCMDDDCKTEFHRDCDPDPSAPNACFANGWIRFDKQLPKKPAGSASKGEIKISRDEDGRITGVKTESGGFANAAELLRLIKDALRRDRDLSLKLKSGDGGFAGATELLRLVKDLNKGSDFSLELNAEGGAKIRAGAKKKP